MLVQKEKNGWVKVTVLNQHHYAYDAGWYAQEGWIKKEMITPIKTFSPYKLTSKKALKHLLPPESSQSPITLAYNQIDKPLSAELTPEQVLSYQPLRERIIAAAKNYLSRDAHAQTVRKKKNTRPRIDCSDLIQRAYRACGITIPRNSHQQFLHSKKIKVCVPLNLKPADLIFSAPADKPHRITHVMMYIGNGELIESTGKHEIKHKQFLIRTAPVKRRIGKSLEQLAFGGQARYSHLAKKFVYYFGTFFPPTKTSSHPRQYARTITYG